MCPVRHSALQLGTFLVLLSQDEYPPACDHSKRAFTLCAPLLCS